ncbi:uncharacterized protein E0L32_006112 [Thyridium curvatum]|uniref:NmrA-like domain-containing protein n=1 Tax=Thyridium curvatum TaxID=1093900 RepID=A0A507ATS4_9PEZI|nr:uncharacterized protein E0L32_006112 [Thyridium curvatum]TPX13382.1 hypothetical protein E0L32_006112 [Thyridium curvatum]
MVRIVIAGGTSSLASEVIDGLAATGRHEIILFSRQDTSTEGLPSSLEWRKVDYENLDQLTEALQGVNTVLSFIVAHLDPGNASQKNLITASIKAGVKRFAPSEWMTSKLDHMSWYANKAELREYLEEINKDKKAIEYCLFQPGYFMDYLAAPHQITKHIHQQETYVNFERCQALLVDGDDNARVVFTSVKDIVNVVVLAVDYIGEWPVTGGIQGQEISIADVLALGKKIRGASVGTSIIYITVAHANGRSTLTGREFAVERLSAAELKAGEFNAKGWSPRIDHPSIPPEQLEVMAKAVNSAVLLATGAGAFQVSDEWNRLLPDYRFTTIEELMNGVFKHKS